MWPKTKTTNDQQKAIHCVSAEGRRSPSANANPGASHIELVRCLPKYLAIRPGWAAYPQPPSPRPLSLRSLTLSSELQATPSARILAWGSFSTTPIGHADRQLSRLGRLGRLAFQHRGQLSHKVAEHPAQNGGDRDEQKWI
jgi:hypothetical protein